MRKNSDIERIHSNGELSPDKFGVRAAQLRRLNNIGIPTPDGFLIPVTMVQQFAKLPGKKISAQIKGIEGLYSLRASPTSTDWPGFGSILNLGMSDQYVETLISYVGKRDALELYRRFICSFGILVFGLDSEIFENLLYDRIRLLNLDDETELDEAALGDIVDESKREYEKQTGSEFPQKLVDQIDLAFTSLCENWNRPSAVLLRKARGAPKDAGLGVILQEMVLGIGPNFSGSGQVKTVNKDSGRSVLEGYFLPNSQGADAFAGLKTPHMLSEDQRIAEGQTAPSLEKMDNLSFNGIKDLVWKTVLMLGDAFNFEFTIEANKFYFLDAILAERSPQASVRIAVDLVNMGAISEEEAVMRVAPHNLVEFLHPQVNSSFDRRVFGKGLPASPGAVSGKIVFSNQAASNLSSKGEPAILVRTETTPEDIAGIHDSVGVLTVRGGMTSHAAVIARGLGLPCVVGVNSLAINNSDKTLVSESGEKFSQGDMITLDGTAGEVLSGEAEMTQPIISGAFSTLMDWADKHRKISVRGNADTPQEAKLAKNFGADGIGLCRTEHMFLETHKLIIMREMILADSLEKRRQALNKLLPMQREDFIKFFEIMKGMPVTIRLLDPPLHEFLPHSDEEMLLLAESMNVPFNEILDRSNEIQEFNPMLGKRGVRLGVTMPEIYEMQAEAIFEATAYVNSRSNIEVAPEIMIPLVSATREVELISSQTARICQQIEKSSQKKISYKLGVIIETPRAALRANELSHSCDFLSFGTNDLTQMTYGLSRDDAGRFMRTYLEKDVFPWDPFHSLDFDGVGELISLGCERARATKASVELGLCGEHGGDPSSIKFCKSLDFDYVSCSPFRIPIARLAAAQASIALKTSNQ